MMGRQIETPEGGAGKMRHHLQMDLSRKMFTSFGVKLGEGECMYPPLPYRASAVYGSIRKLSPRSPQQPQAAP